MKKITISLVALGLLALGISTMKTEDTVIKRGSKVEWSNYIFADAFEINNNGRGHIYVEGREISNGKTWYGGIDLNTVLKTRELTVTKKTIFNLIHYKTEYRFGKTTIEELKEEIKKAIDNM